MSRPRKTDQAALARLGHLLVRKIADLQVTGKTLLFRAPAWSDPADMIHARGNGPFQFHLVPDYLVLLEVELSDPTTVPCLDKAVQDLESQGHLHRIPLTLADHHDLAYKRSTGEIVVVRVSPADCEVTIDLYGSWPVPPATVPLQRYLIPLQEEGQPLGIGYRLSETGVALLNQTGPVPTEQARVSPTDTLTPQQVADRYNVDLDKVYNWIKTGTLTAVDVSSRPGGRKKRYAIRPQDLDAFEHRQAVNPPPTPPRRKRRDPTVKKFF